MLTRAEMNAMKQAMEGASKENARLNGEMVRMMERRIAQPDLTAKRLFELAQKAEICAWPGSTWEECVGVIQGKCQAAVASDPTLDNPEQGEWKAWVRLVLAGTLPSNATAEEIRKSVIDAWDGVLKENAKLRGLIARAGKPKGAPIIPMPQQAPKPPP